MSSDNSQSNLRIHLGTREPLSRSGGLHSYIRGLTMGQREIGLNPVILEGITPAGTFNVGFGSLPKTLYSQDRVHIHFAQTGRPVLRRHRNDWNRAGQVIHFHGPWFAEGRAQGNAWPRTFGKWLLEMESYWSRSSTFIVASTAFAAVLHRSFGIPSRRIHVVEIGVDSRRFSPGDQKRARKALGLPLDMPTVVAVRRLEPRMGLEILLEAAAAVDRSIHFAICGTGSIRNELERQVERLDLSSRVVFLGRVSDQELPEVYRAADLSVVPTVSLEGFGMTVRESMACGTPVISTTVGGLPEAQGPFADEWTVPGGSVDALADRIGVALAESDESIRNECRAFAMRNSFEEMARKVEHAMVS